MMKNIPWNAPYLDRKVWLLENLENLNVDVREILVLLLIDHFNLNKISVHHELIASKLKITVDDVEQIFTDLSDKGYLDITFKEGELIFDISGVFDLEAIKEVGSVKSILEEFEEEFGRSFNSNEMNRILSLVDLYDERMVRVALNEAAACEKRNLNYIEAILASWKEKGFSPEDVEEGKQWFQTK